MLSNRPYFGNLSLPRAANPLPNFRISNRQFIAIRRAVSCISTLALDHQLSRRASTHRPICQPVNGPLNAFVVGGGPAGLAAAIGLRQKGFAVRVADGAKPPIDKACGEGLMPDTVRALQRMGVEVPSQDSYPLRGIRFVSGGAESTGDFSGGLGLGVRRTALHACMVAQAEKFGVQCLWNTPVTGLTAGGVQAHDQIFAADWIIGADGSRSRTRKWAGLEDSKKRAPRYAFRTHFRRAPWSEYVEIHWSNAAQAYVTPVAHDEVCIVVLSEQPNMRAEIIPTLFPDLARASRQIAVARRRTRSHHHHSPLAPRLPRQHRSRRRRFRLRRRHHRRRSEPRFSTRASSSGCLDFRRYFQLSEGSPQAPVPPVRHGLLPGPPRPPEIYSRTHLPRLCGRSDTVLQFSRSSLGSCLSSSSSAGCDQTRMAFCDLLKLNSFL